MDGTLSLSAQITFRVSQDPIEGRICHSLHIINLETPWINDERRTVQSGAGATAPEDATTHLCECCDQSEFEGSQLRAFCLLSTPESCVHTHTHTHLHPAIDVCTAAAELLTEYFCSSKTKHEMKIEIKITGLGDLQVSTWRYCLIFCLYDDWQKAPNIFFLDSPEESRRSHPFFSLYLLFCLCLFMYTSLAQYKKVWQVTFMISSC